MTTSHSNSISVVLQGRPITKKNSQQITRNKATGRPGVIQSKRYREYEKDCLWQLVGVKETLAGPVEMTARYYMPDRRSWPDLLGLLQATADIVEKAGLIEDDKNIVSFGESKIEGIDRECPRAEVVIKKNKLGGR